MKNIIYTVAIILLAAISVLGQGAPTGGSVSGGVKTLNGGRGAITLAGAGGVSVARSGQTITITGSASGVTSVGLALPNIFTVSNSPVTTTGTLTGTLATQNANIIFAGPTSGGAATPSFRSLVVNDLPGSIPYSKLTLTDSIVNADINSAAAIGYSKLNLTGAILNADLAGSITASKLVGTDITTVGTIGTGTWQGTTIAAGYGGTGQTTLQASINALMAASGALSSGDIFYYNGTNIVRLPKGSDTQVLTLASGLPSWAASSSGVTGSGTTGTIPVWSSSTALGNSPILVSSGKVGIGATGDGYINVEQASGFTQQIRLRNTSATNAVSQQSTMDLGFSDSYRLIIAVASTNALGSPYNGSAYINSINIPYKILYNGTLVQQYTTDAESYFPNFVGFGSVTNPTVPIDLSASSGLNQMIKLRNTNAGSSSGQQAVIDLGFDDSRRLIVAAASDTGIATDYNASHYLNYVGVPLRILSGGTKVVQYNTDNTVTHSTANTFGAAITSTVSTGTAPFVVASTTNVANLNASSLNGATFAAPGAIGGGTPSSGAFTTLSGSTSLTVGGGTAVTKIISAAATLDFGDLATEAYEDKTITVTGAATGDVVEIGLPTNAMPGSPSVFCFFTAWVSAADTVTIRASNPSTSINYDPPSGSYRVAVKKF